MKAFISVLTICAVLLSSLGIGQVGYAMPNHVPEHAKNNAANRVVDVSLSETELSLPLGESKKVDGIVTYSNHKTDTKLSWVSDNPSIATVTKEGIVQASETNTGYATITATASRGQSQLAVDVVVAVYNPETSIATARTKIGEEVTVTGIVSVDNYQLQGNRLNVYIQDSTAGIQLFHFTPQDFVDVKEGDLVSVTGTVGVYTGVTQLTVSSMDIVKRNQSIQAKALHIADLSNPELAEQLQGQVVSFEGYFQTVPTYYLGGANLSAIDEDFNTVLLRVWETTGIELSSVKSGNWYQITGIMSKYNDTYQILPRKASDVQVTEVQKEKPTTNQREFKTRVERVVDGDTIRITDPVFGATNVRFLNIDTAETYHAVRNDLDQHQMDFGKEQGDFLKNYLQDGDEIIVRLGEEPLDSYGRLLAEVITLDGVNTNLEMVRHGQAVTYFIYPFENHIVEKYVEAAKEARELGLGIWNEENPLLEAPFVFRARERGEASLSRYVGNVKTKEYVLPNQYSIIEPEYRVFFTEKQAINLGYTKKELSNQELAFVDKNEVMLQVRATHNVSRLSEDVTLPEKARYGSSVTWESDNVNVISHSGVINKGLSEKASATLTATVTNGVAEQKLHIEVTVLEPIINLVHWNFEDQNEVADGGVVSNVNRQIGRESFISPTFPQGTGGSGTYAYNTNNWQNGANLKYYQINFETIGFKNIKLSSKQFGSNTGPRDFTLQYSVDNLNWYTFGPNIVVANNWNSAVIDDVLLPEQVENKENVYVRWMMTSDTSIAGGTVASGGTSRIDDIKVTGTPMPVSDEKAVELDKKNLEVIFQDEDSYAHVKKDVLLPSSGINGSTITWTSSEPSVISNGGIVNPQNENREVNLTATISKGSSSLLKHFTLLVVADGPTVPTINPLIGFWHFNTSGFTTTLVSGQDLQADVGSAQLRTTVANLSEFAGSTMNAQEGITAGGSLSLVSSVNNGRYVELEFSTIGLKDIEISFATRGTSTGFSEHSWEYSTNGADFQQFGNNTESRESNYELKTVSLPSITSNKNNVVVRLYVDGATGISGNNRIDNLTITGKVIE